MLDVLEYLLPNLDEANTKAIFAQELLLKMKAGDTIFNGDVHQGEASTIGIDDSKNKYLG